MSVHRGRDACRLRQKFAHRMLKSRFVRVKKPEKYKYRWVLRGFNDPDLLKVKREAPMVSASSVPFGLQTLSSHRYRLHLGDISS